VAGLPARRLALSVAAFAVALVVAAAAGDAARRPSTTKFSHPSKCITDNSPQRGRTTIFGELQRLGVRVWSRGISWASIATGRPRNPRSPRDPAYRWPPRLDVWLDRALANGIEPVLAVNGFPAWSNGGRPPMWAGEQPKDYGDFMAAAVRRYPQVRRWIAFSEPTSYTNFRPQGEGGRRSPPIYARLLDAAYGAMHAVRRDVLVIGGNIHPAGFNDDTTTAPDRFLRLMMLPNGKRPRLDVFGVNPFTEREIDVALPHRKGRIDFNDLDWLVRQLDRYWPRRRLKLFVDEFGWNTEHEATGWLYVVSRTRQAADLRRAYAAAAAVGRVDTLCWYQLYDEPPRREGGMWQNWTSGLRTYGGARKPSWLAFKRVPSGPRRLP
jgi:hypothetical protein